MVPPLMCETKVRLFEYRINSPNAMVNAEESDLTPSTYCSSIDVTCTHVMDYNDVFPDSLKNGTASKITDTLVSATEKNSGFCSIVLLFLLLLPLSFGLFFSFTRRPLFAPYLLIYDRVSSIDYTRVTNRIGISVYTQTITRDD